MSADVHEGQLPSDRMMEYDYAMGQDCLASDQYEDAVIYFRKAARLGAPEAASEIGMLGEKFERGVLGPPDQKKAFLCYEIGVEFHDEHSLLQLGKLFMHGFPGYRPNIRKARRLLEEASEKGNREAAALLARMFDEGTLGKVNRSQAFQYYLLAAQRGDPGAMLMTGLFYAEGGLVPKDVRIAEQWIRKGRELQDPDGDLTLRTFLGVACIEYITGQAGRIDDRMAFSMAEEAAGLGDYEVWLRLGETYRDADRRPGHEDRAFECFKKGAVYESAASQSALGLCWESGIGTKPDVEEAVRWYRKAAGNGDAFAMARLGYAYENGAGTAKDEKKAMEWLIQAALRGDQGAVRTLHDDYGYTLS